MENALVTAEMLAPITKAITDNVGVILPVGMTIMGIFIAIKVIPRVIKYFTKG